MRLWRDPLIGALGRRAGLLKLVEAVAFGSVAAASAWFVIQVFINLPVVRWCIDAGAGR